MNTSTTYPRPSLCRLRRLTASGLQPKRLFWLHLTSKR